jgi:hypothetical protein
VAEKEPPRRAPIVKRCLHHQVIRMKASMESKSDAEWAGM